MADLPGTIPDDLRYTADHEWVALSGEEARVGITAYATEALGDVVFVDLPAVGTTVAARERCAEIESTKAVAEVYAPVAGTVVAVNDVLTDQPERIGAEPYGDGWMFTLAVAEVADIEALLDAAAYRALTEDRSDVAD